MLVAEKGLELAEAELAERKRQLAYDIKARYIDAVAAKEKVEAIDRIVAVNREAYRLVDARVQRDDAAPLERQLLLVELNRTEAQRATTAGQAQAAQSELLRTIGVTMNGPAMTLAKRERLATDVTASLEEIRRRALESRPDLRAIRTFSSQDRQPNSTLSEAQGRPDLTVSAQYARRYSQFEDPLRTTGSGSPLLTSGSRQHSDVGNLNPAADA